MRSSRIRVIEIIVAIAVTMISVASLFVAVFQGVIMQRQLEASVLPIPTVAHGPVADACARTLARVSTRQPRCSKRARSA